MADLFPISNQDVVQEMERELRMRASVYSRQVADGRLKKAEADRRIAIVQKIITDYRTGGPR